MVLVNLGPLHSTSFTVLPLDFDRFHFGQVAQPEVHRSGMLRREGIPGNDLGYLVSVLGLEPDFCPCCEETIG